jgi:hypothetical protein
MYACDTTSSQAAAVSDLLKQALPKNPRLSKMMPNFGSEIFLQAERLDWENRLGT